MGCGATKTAGPEPPPTYTDLSKPARSPSPHEVKKNPRYQPPVKGEKSEVSGTHLTEPSIHEQDEQVAELSVHEWTPSPHVSPRGQGGQTPRQASPRVIHKSPVMDPGHAQLEPMGQATIRGPLPPLPLPLEGPPMPFIPPGGPEMEGVERATPVVPPITRAALRVIAMFRAALGLAPWTYDPVLSSWGQAHANYVILNTRAGRDVVMHSESRRLPGYSDEGERAARCGMVIGAEDTLLAVYVLMQGPLLRRGLLAREAMRVGIGHLTDAAMRKSVAVVVTQPVNPPAVPSASPSLRTPFRHPRIHSSLAHGPFRTAPERVGPTATPTALSRSSSAGDDPAVGASGVAARFVVFPPPNMPDVPTTFFEDVPDPRRGFAGFQGQPTGFPVTVHMSSADARRLTTTTCVVHARTATVHEDVPCWVADPAKPSVFFDTDTLPAIDVATHGLTRDIIRTNFNSVFILPTEPLYTSAVYTVSITLAFEGEPEVTLSWSFGTTKDTTFKVDAAPTKFFSSLDFVLHRIGQEWGRGGGDRLVLGPGTFEISSQTKRPRLLHIKGSGPDTVIRISKPPEHTHPDKPLQLRQPADDDTAAFAVRGKAAWDIRDLVFTGQGPVVSVGSKCSVSLTEVEFRDVAPRVVSLRDGGTVNFVDCCFDRVGAAGEALIGGGAQRSQAPTSGRQQNCVAMLYGSNWFNEVAGSYHSFSWGDDTQPVWNVAVRASRPQNTMSLADALLVASPGDTLALGPGTFRLGGPTWFPADTALNFAGAGKDDTVIQRDFAGDDVLLACGEGAAVTLANLTLDNTVATRAPLYLRSNSRLELRGVRLVGAGGGALAAVTVDPGATLHLEDCDLRDYRAELFAHIVPVPIGRPGAPGRVSEAGTNVYHARKPGIAGDARHVTYAPTSGRAGVTWQIATNAHDQWSDLTYALRAYGSGDILSLAPGRYVRNESASLAVGSQVTISGHSAGKSGAVAVLARGAGTSEVASTILSVGQGARVTLRNLTLDNGDAAEPPIFVDEGGELMLEHVCLTGFNRAHLAVLDNNARLTISHCDLNAFNSPSIAFARPDSEVDPTLAAGTVTWGAGNAFRGRPPTVIGPGSTPVAEATPAPGQRGAVWEVEPEGNPEQRLGRVLQRYGGGDLIILSPGRHVLEDGAWLETRLALTIHNDGRGAAVISRSGLCAGDSMFTVREDARLSLRDVTLDGRGSTPLLRLHAGSVVALERVRVVNVARGYLATVDRGALLTIKNCDFSEYLSPQFVFLSGIPDAGRTPGAAEPSQTQGVLSEGPGNAFRAPRPINGGAGFIACPMFEPVQIIGKDGRPRAFSNPAPIDTTIARYDPTTATSASASHTPTSTAFSAVPPTTSALGIRSHRSPSAPRPTLATPEPEGAPSEDSLEGAGVQGAEDEDKDKVQPLPSTSGGRRGRMTASPLLNVVSESPVLHAPQASRKPQRAETAPRPAMYMKHPPSPKKVYPPALVGTLTVVIHSAHHLPTDFVGTISVKRDPYVIVRIGGLVEKTSTLRNSTEPVWDETMVFKLKGQLDQQRMRCTVMDLEYLAGDILVGDIMVDLHSLKNDGTVNELKQKLTIPAATAAVVKEPLPELWLSVSFQSSIVPGQSKLSPRSLATASLPTNVMYGFMSATASVPTGDPKKPG